MEKSQGSSLNSQSQLASHVSEPRWKLILYSHLLLSAAEKGQSATSKFLILQILHKIKCFFWATKFWDSFVMWQ